MIPKSTPMTMPAIAPGLRPLLVVVAVMPAVAPPTVGLADWKGTVVVAEPVEVTVWTVLLVGRTKAVPDAAAVTEE